MLWHGASKIYLTITFAGEMRVVLFLQGHPSFFARDLANEIERLGHRALRINLCAGAAEARPAPPSQAARSAVPPAGSGS
jgi:hypothetical protein